MVLLTLFHAQCSNDNQGDKRRAESVQTIQACLTRTILMIVCRCIRTILRSWDGLFNYTTCASHFPRPVLLSTSIAVAGTTRPCRTTLVEQCVVYLLNLQFSSTRAILASILILTLEAKEASLVSGFCDFGRIPVKSHFLLLFLHRPHGHYPHILTIRNALVSFQRH